MEYLLDSDDEAFANMLMEAWLTSPEPETPNDTDTSSNDTPPETSDKAITPFRKPRITFLDLPDHVRLRIYQYSGLFRQRCITFFNYEKMRKINSKELDTCALRAGKRESSGFWYSPYVIHCDHPAFPMGVFLASRAIRLDIVPHFFGLNNFAIDICCGADFRLFCTATERGYQYLKSLHIDLRPGDNRYLKIGSGVHRTIMNAWDSFCKIAQTQMPLLRLFSFKCKVKDLEVASRLMCSMESFPILSECSFHLNNYHDEFMQPVIKRAALRLTENLGDRPPFPYMRLPKEVQLMILDQLLTNQGDPYIQFSDWSKGIVSFQHRKRPRQPFHELYPLTCCGTCSPVRSVCFCQTRQTAFSTTCSCFLSPVSYFLVSRGFYEDARRVFFSKNNFVFLEEDPEFMMRIMHYIPTSSFMQIRYLSFKFPLTCRVAARPGHKPEDSALLSWSVLRRFIREHFDLERLSLMIVDLGTKQSFPNATPNRNKYLRKLLKSFADLRGLRDFRVYLADDRIFERDAEKAVLGPERAGRSKLDVMPFIGQKHLSSSD
ncbi:hypothetical protein AWENTII_012887 [Aspergillus wentii]